MADSTSSGVTIDLSGVDVQRALREAPARLATELRRELASYMRRFVSPAGAWQRAFMRGRPGVRRGTGDLAKSFQAIDVTQGSGLGDVAARAFTTKRYAHVHELGATIQAKRERVVSYARESKEFGQRVFSKRVALLTWKVGTGKRARWYSKRQVTIPARLHFFDSFSADDGGRAIMVARAVAKALGENPPRLGSAAAQKGPSLPPSLSAGAFAPGGE